MSTHPSASVGPVPPTRYDRFVTISSASLPDRQLAIRDLYAFSPEKQALLSAQRRLENRIDLLEATSLSGETVFLISSLVFGSGVLISSFLLGNTPYRMLLMFAVGVPSAFILTSLTCVAHALYMGSRMRKAEEEEMALAVRNCPTLAGNIGIRNKDVF